jgi:hypothetical protein
VDASRYRGMGVARMDRKGHSSDFDGLQLLSHWAAKPRCKNIHRSRGKALARMWRLVTGSKEIFDISQGKKGGSARPTLGIPCKSIHPCPRGTSLAKRCRPGPNKRVGSRPEIGAEGVKTIFSRCAWALDKVMITGRKGSTPTEVGCVCVCVDVTPERGRTDS